MTWSVKRVEKLARNFTQEDDGDSVEQIPAYIAGYRQALKDTVQMLAKQYGLHLEFLTNPAFGELLDQIKGLSEIEGG